MVYAEKTNYKQNNFFKKLRIKILKKIAKSFPLNKIRVFALRRCGFKLGKKVYIGEDLIVASIISEKSCYLKVGDRVAIGPRVTILLSSDANWSKLMLHIEPIKSTVILEDDCWIGASAVILPGIKIGKSAIVAAGAVVTKDVKPYTVVAGVPAKIIKTIESL
jgi:maltose O-acetyltransferase